MELSLEDLRVKCALARLSATSARQIRALARVSATFGFLDIAVVRVSGTLARQIGALASVLAPNLSYRSRIPPSSALSRDSQPLRLFRGLEPKWLRTVRSHCLESLFEVAGLCFTVLCIALALFDFTPCMYMHGFTLVYIYIYIYLCLLSLTGL